MQTKFNDFPKEIGSKTIYLSKDYDKFHFMDENGNAIEADNRDIKSKHVRSLAESMLKTKGNTQAIICIEKDGKLYIIDGQHRAKGCILAKLPIKYEIIDRIEELSLRQFIVELNIHSMKWTPEVFFRTKAKEGDPLYAYYIELIDIWNWSTIFPFMRITPRQVKADMRPAAGRQTTLQLDAMESMNYDHKKITKAKSLKKRSMRTRDLAIAFIAIQERYDLRRKRGEKLPAIMDYEKIKKSFKHVIPNDGIVDDPKVFERKISEALDFGRNKKDQLKL